LGSLEAGIGITRTHRHKFHLSEEEVIARETFIDETRDALETMAGELRDGHDRHFNEAVQGRLSVGSDTSEEERAYGNGALGSYPPIDNSSGGYVYEGQSMMRRSDSWPGDEIDSPYGAQHAGITIHMAGEEEDSFQAGRARNNQYSQIGMVVGVTLLSIGALGFVALGRNMGIV